MPTAPPMMIVAQIRQGREKPGAERGVGSQAQTLLIEANEGLGDQVLRVGFVLAVTIRKAMQRSLPPRDQTVQGSGFALLQRQ